jgi:hypothetical protein
VVSYGSEKDRPRGPGPILFWDEKLRSWIMRLSESAVLLFLIPLII